MIAAEAERSTAQRATLFTVLAVALTVTRFHHFGAIPDATWAVFFLGGFYLRGAARWAFPALMALAVVVDWLVIRSTGGDFWTHYCVSPAYWCLVPAYFALWAGGDWLRRRYARADLRALAYAAASLLVAVALCHLISQGSFYWVSSSVQDPTLAGWWKNYSDWFLPYLGVAAMYVGIAALLQVAVEQLAGARTHASRG